MALQSRRTLNSSARNMGALAVCGTSGDSMTAYSVLHTRGTMS